MAFRFNKKIKLGKEFGVSMGKSRVTPSYRTENGCFSPKEYSMKTSTLGLTYRKTFSKAKILELFMAALLSVIFISSCASVDNEKTDDFSSINCKDTNCANYTSQSAAQAAYNANPECRNDLDADNDGIACEEPGNSIKTCASTSNCGCSNKNKAPCQANPCCRWVIGEGCKCN